MYIRAGVQLDSNNCGHIFGLVTTQVFDFLTSKSNQFVFVPGAQKVVNLVKFP